ncbi:MAG: hypothetical protein ACTSRK_16945 [Promethearchaeota archaeon]
MDTIQILSGIPRKEIIEYFTSPEGQFQDGKEGKEDKEENVDNFLMYTSEKCEVKIYPTAYPSNSAFTIPRTKIIFQGPEKQVTRLVTNFRKKFLRGGG